MIEVIPFDTLGRLEAGWLSARYHFSFANYYDADRMGVGALRVWNDDRVRPGGGFPRHPHRDFEIITYVRKGAVTHEDTLGNRGVTRAGEVQVMSAGTGIAHSEYNHEDGDLELFQIWIAPDVKGVTPRWETRPLAGDGTGLRVLASGRPGDDGALPIHQNAALVAGLLGAGEAAEHALAPGRHAYLVPVRGAIVVNRVPARPRDGVHVTDVATLEITAAEETELVLVDVP